MGEDAPVPSLQILGSGLKDHTRRVQQLVFGILRGHGNGVPVEECCLTG